jgi:3-hydroxyacyl-CoA dehydrogenase
VTETTRLDRQGAVAIITLAAPPVNALGHALRHSLDAAIAACAADQSLRALVIRADGPVFSAGADIREFADPPRPPLLTDICRRIESLPIPVIAVLQGPALGGGAEIALAAHYRLAGPAARIGLPEVRLGLIPGAGGTQRLPRLVGAEAALLLMTEGQSLDATAAEAIGLVDGILPDPTPAAAAAFAEGLIARELGPRPTLDLTDFAAEPALWLAAVAETRAARRGVPLLAQRRLADCVEAALLLPADAGLAYERAAFEDCLASPESAALRRLFLAERRLPARLGARGADATVTLAPAGQGVAARLDSALARAGVALARAGTTAAILDAGLAQLGLAADPDPDDGPTPDAADVATVARACLSAVMAEGARLLSESIVPRAADIDVIAVAGANWPRLSGGPMQAAMQQGLLHLLREMEGLAPLDPIWSPAPALQEAVKYAGGFDALPSANATEPALNPG